MNGNSEHIKFQPYDVLSRMVKNNYIEIEEEYLDAMNTAYKKASHTTNTIEKCLENKHDEPKEEDMIEW